MNVADLVNALAGMPPEMEVMVSIIPEEIICVDSADDYSLFVNAVEYGDSFKTDSGIQEFQPIVLLISNPTHYTPKINKGWVWTEDGFRRTYDN